LKAEKFVGGQEVVEADISFGGSKRCGSPKRCGRLKLYSDV